LFRIASGLLAVETDGVTHYSLIGVDADLLVNGSEADLPTLFGHELGWPRRLEQGNRRDPRAPRRRSSAPLA
jgi:hypothetical protein